LDLGQFASPTLARYLQNAEFLKQVPGEPIIRHSDELQELITEAGREIAKQIVTDIVIIVAVPKVVGIGG
jgi:hypothetical protein